MALTEKPVIFYNTTHVQVGFYSIATEMFLGMEQYEMLWNLQQQHLQCG